MTQDYLDEYVFNEDFRLVLRYKPYGKASPAPYENRPTDFDTMIITDSFTLIKHTPTVIYGNEEPCIAAGYTPFYSIEAYLNFFGF